MGLLDRLDAIDRRLGLQRARPPIDDQRTRQSLVVIVAAATTWLVLGAVYLVTRSASVFAVFMWLGAGLLIGARLAGTVALRGERKASDE